MMLGFMEAALEKFPSRVLEDIMMQLAQRIGISYDRHFESMEQINLIRDWHNFLVHIVKFSQCHSLILEFARLQIEVNLDTAIFVIETLVGHRARLSSSTENSLREIISQLHDCGAIQNQLMPQMDE
jgi:hypothetical protein